MISNFVYYAPTKVVFGRGSETQVGQLIKEYNGRKVLIHYGGNRIKESGLFDRIVQSLNAAGLHWFSLGGVVSNPRLSLVYHGIELCKQEGVDFILAVGGGSVIDSAKTIGYGAACDGDVWDLYDRRCRASGTIPVGSVLTIAAAGSEMSNSSVVTRDDDLLKRSYNDELGRPKFAVMNPELTMTVPQFQTACGCVDIMLHTLERYFCREERLDITNSLAESLLKNVMKNAVLLREDPFSYEARAEMMWCGSLSHNGITGSGPDRGDWACHMMEHELSGMFDVAHGAGLAAIWGSWARYVMKYQIPRFRRLAVNVMEIADDSDEQITAEKGIEAIEHFWRSIDMPTSLNELGIDPTDAQIDHMAKKYAQANPDNAGAVKRIAPSDMVSIFRQARTK